MAALREIYKCSVCGDMVEVIHAGSGTLVCDGQPMQRLMEKTTDVGNEKHVPVIEKTTQGILVRIGTIPHPMEEKHFIEWVELIADGVVFRQWLKPGMKPEALFPVVKATTIQAREHCNIHGLWSSK